MEQENEITIKDRNGKAYLEVYKNQSIEKEVYE